jgi:hypothetical protein
MWTDRALLKLKLSDKTEYCREDLFNVFRTENRELNNSSFRWILYNLLQEQKVFRTDYNTYVIEKPYILPIYKPHYTGKARALMEMLEKRYPELAFVVFESALLNEFLNHQIAQNTIYVQVEKDVSSYIFDMIQEKYNGNVLYKPDKKEFDKYWTRDCVVVLDLISQPPLSKDNPHEITPEKLLIDIIAEKSIAATFSPSEIPYIYNHIMRTYRVEKRKMNRYAGRRGKKTQLKKIIGA